MNDGGGVDAETSPPKAATIVHQVDAGLAAPSAFFRDVQMSSYLVGRRMVVLVLRMEIMFGWVPGCRIQ